MVKIVVCSPSQGKLFTLRLNLWAKVLLSVCVLGIPGGIGLLIGKHVNGNPSIDEAVKALKAQLARQRDDSASGERDAGRQVEALTQKLAEMQARLVRLDALGERLTAMAGLDDGEFDFSSPPAVGGPEELSTEPATGNATDNAALGPLFASLDAQINNREQQLTLLGDMIKDRELKRDLTVAGWPLLKGSISSPFGVRRDPFNGRRAMHRGMDFAGKAGAPVVAVAAGIVVRAEEYKGYGRLVELDHGDGLITRYGHNRATLVQAGDSVAKGQAIALVGSTGRSTGPHVHFEVFKNGRAVDPASYIHRTVH